MSEAQKKNQISREQVEDNGTDHSISFLFMFAGVVGYEASMLPLQVNSSNETEGSTGANTATSESNALETMKHGE